MRKFLGTVFIVILVFFFAGCFLAINGLMKEFPGGDVKVNQASILSMKLEGIIMDPAEFLANLRKYAKQDRIKGVLIQVNSPGGVVGPSQELYAEIMRVRTELKKPVVISCSSLMASGAYYAAVAGNRIFVNPGSLVGSIGVIMEFANLERLYQWAKIQRFVVKTGAYKDSGAEYRPMREDERQLFQTMAFEVLGQFKRAVAQGRKLAPGVVDKYADGRVFTGETAVKLGLADKIGTFVDAVREVGQLSGLGTDPKLFEPPPKRPSFFELFEQVKSNTSLAGMAKQVMHTELWGQPLFLFPAALPAVK